MAKPLYTDADRRHTPPLFRLGDPAICVSP